MVPIPQELSGSMARGVATWAQTPGAAFALTQTRALADSPTIDRILRRVLEDRIPVQLIAPRSGAQTVALSGLEPGGLRLRAKDPEATGEDEVLVVFDFDGQPHSFNANVVAVERGVVLLSRPTAIDAWERRDRLRSGGRPASLTLRLGGGGIVEASVVDTSPAGLGVLIPDDADVAPGEAVEVQPGAGTPERAVVRNVAPSAGQRGWRRVGLLRGAGPAGRLIDVERPSSIFPSQKARQAAGPPTTSRYATFENDRGERLVAIIDTWGNRVDGPAIVVPSAWGNTKETLVALSEAIVSVFRQAELPVTVVRFDGAHRAGVGHREPDAQARGRENLHYTFSQGVRDLGAVLDFLESDPAIQPKTFAIVSFSISSVEARRALVQDAGRRVSAWISVVGASDPQSLLRVLSGGEDYFAKAEQGVRLGVRDVQGQALDVDNAGRDAFEHQLAFLDDARRDMAAIDVPVTWLHGANDGWNQLGRARDMLSSGDYSNRRLVLLPTGHQLRTSREAAEVFQFVGVEAARLTLGAELEPVRVDPGVVRARRRAERSHAKRPPADLRRFWRAYLLGEKGDLGIELVASMSDYESLMAAQIDALQLTTGDRLVDLGSGTGTLPLALARTVGSPRPSLVIEVDFVAEALVRARDRLQAREPSARVTASYVVADLSSARAGVVPLGDERADAVLASLLLNYLPKPDAMLKDCLRILSSGGRLVASAMRRDADVSRICVAGLEELRAGRARRFLGGDGGVDLDEPLRAFISRGGELLGIESEGQFQFWDAEELEAMLEASGFVDVGSAPAYGSPAQATIVWGRRP